MFLTPGAPCDVGWGAPLHSFQAAPTLQLQQHVRQGDDDDEESWAEEEVESKPQDMMGTDRFQGGCSPTAVTNGLMTI